MSDVVRFPRPEIVATMSGPGHWSIEASAGTGKTFLIEHRIADLILTGAATIDQILVVTFTEKATAELKRRVRQLLARIAACGSDQADDSEPHWRIDAAARARIEDASIASDRGAIFTIHGLCHRLIQESAFTGGRLFEQHQVVDEAAFHEAFLEALRRSFARDELHLPYLGAWLDTGSTVEQLSSLLYRCSRGAGAFANQFDEEALARALDRAAALFATGDPKSDIERAEGIHANSRRAALKRLERMRAVTCTWQAGGAHPVAMLTALAEADLGALSRLPNAAGPVVEVAVAIEAARVPLAAAIAERFTPIVGRHLEIRKKQHGQFDFQDMLEATWQALESPAGGKLATRLRSRYRHALIDEFQDTDELQWKIFRRLFLESPDENWLTVVGDPKQAIYSFRGADLRAYQAAVRELEAAGGRTLALDTNYRSTAPMVTALNWLFEDRAEPFFSDGIGYHPVACGQSKRLRSVQGGELAPLAFLEVTGPKLRARELKHRVNQAICGEVEALLRSPPIIDGSDPRPLSAADVFVLTRSTAEAEEIAENLRARGVPCALYQHEGLFQTAEALEVLDLLSAIASPGDRSARLRAWQTRFFSAELRELRHLADLPDTDPRVALLYEWHGLANQREYERLLSRIVSDSGIIERLLLSEPSERALTNFLHIFELILAEILNARVQPSELVRRYQAWVDDTRGWDAAEKNLQRFETDESAVQVMTIHKSKGLEAAVVFLSGGFSRQQSRDGIATYHEGDRRVVHVGRVEDEAVRERIDGEARAEDERLMYVAATRAVGRLYLPRVGEQTFRVSGAYAPIHRRLTPEVDELTPALFDLLPAEGDSGRQHAEIANSETLSEFRSAPDAAVRLEPSRPLGSDRHGFQITSYSRLKAAKTAAPLDAGSAVEVGPAELPAGRESGLFLHLVLEHLPLDIPRDAADFEEFAADPEVVRLFEWAMHRYDREPRHLLASQRLIYDAVTAPFSDGVGLEIPALTRCQRERREAEFLYPVLYPGGRERAFIKGFIDVVFEHEGRLYILDWKSDVLADSSPGALADHVAAQYQLQAHLYSLALVRMLGGLEAPTLEERYGGVIYSFLRYRSCWIEPFRRDQLERREHLLSATQEVLR